MVDDICLACKERIQLWEQKRNAEKVMAHQEQMIKEITKGESSRKKIASKKTRRK